MTEPIMINWVALRGPEMVDRDAAFEAMADLEGCRKPDVFDYCEDEDRQQVGDPKFIGKTDLEIRTFGVRAGRG